MDAEQNQGGIGCALFIWAVAQVPLLCFKLSGHLDWHWAAVLAPSILYFGLLVVLYAIIIGCVLAINFIKGRRPRSKFNRFKWP